MGRKEGRGKLCVHPNLPTPHMWITPSMLLLGRKKYVSLVRVKCLGDVVSSACVICITLFAAVVRIRLFYL